MEGRKLNSWEERGHRTFWWHAKKIYNIDRPTKYCVVFNTYEDNPKAFSITPFDTLEEAMEEAKLINIMYSDTPKPQKVYVKEGGRYKRKKWYGNDYNLDYSNGGYFWGYAILDMINNKIVKVVNEVRRFGIIIDNKPSLSVIDVLFRGEDEIPVDYIWDRRGEYDGWLQFRWGDRKNALDYVEPEINKENNKIRKSLNVNIDEEDYSEDYLPNTLEEEIVVEEYNDNGNTLDKKESTSSIADILGDNNPLLKLKFN